MTRSREEIIGIKNQMALKNIKQTEIATRYKISQATVSRTIKGERKNKKVINFLQKQDINITS